MTHPEGIFNSNQYRSPIIKKSLKIHEQYIFTNRNAPHFNREKNMENEAHNMSANRNTFKIIFYSDVECPLTRDNSDKIQKKIT